MSESQTSIDPSARISRNPRVTYRDLEEGGVLLHLESGAYHGLNSIGSEIWKRLDDDPTFEELVGRLRDALADPPAQLGHDVEGFVAMMRERDLVRVAGG